MLIEKNTSEKGNSDMKRFDRWGDENNRMSSNKKGDSIGKWIATENTINKRKIEKRYNYIIQRRW